MASEDFSSKFSNLAIGTNSSCDAATSSTGNGAMDADGDHGVRITCFTEDLHEATLHFQIVRFAKQIFVWIGCNSAKFGHLYAALTTPPSNTVGVAALLGGGADSAGSSIARRLAMKTGTSVVLACNIPNSKDTPMIEAIAERKLMEKLKNLGYY